MSKASAKRLYPQQIPRTKLNDGSLADEFPHTYGCQCNQCDAVWKKLQEEEEAGKLQLEKGRVRRK